MNSVHYSSNSKEWETPPEIFDALDAEFHFTLDPAATHANAKCKKYFTIDDDGLSQSWDDEVVFLNPPYGREIGKWIKKANETIGSIVVCLLPARTDTQWFHDFIYHRSEIRFIRGRIKFLSGDQKTKSAAPFPSMIVIFNNVHKER